MKLVTFLLAPLALALPLCGVDLKYWIEPCTRADTSCKADDPQLAEWALLSWQTHADGKLHLSKTADRDEAHIRIHWVGATEGLYGEARPFFNGLIRGAEVYVRADATSMGPDMAAATRRDPLLRDAIVYLTCLHEAGHALGLQHTDAFADIMYSFQFGGDIPEYFGRYRRQLKSRADIAKASAISAQDKARLARAVALLAEPR